MQHSRCLVPTLTQYALTIIGTIGEKMQVKEPDMSKFPNLIRINNGLFLRYQTLKTFAQIITFDRAEFSRWTHNFLFLPLNFYCQLMQLVSSS